jgi:hypothetical protein
MRELRGLAGEILRMRSGGRDDIVYVHVSAEGSSTGGCAEFVRATAIELSAAQTAIAWTTSASVVAGSRWSGRTLL